MNKLIFLTNELLSPTLRMKMNLPISFINFGIIEGKMYSHQGKHGTFCLLPGITKRWGNNVVYGAIFLLQDFDFYSRILDAYHICSMSTLLKNHQYDIHHRVEVKVIPIFFDTLDEFARIKYKESGDAIQVQTYIGNKNHPKIKQRIRQVKANSYRIIDGVDKKHFKELFGEVTN